MINNANIRNFYTELFVWFAMADTYIHILLLEILNM